MPLQAYTFRFVPYLCHIRRNIQRAIRRALKQPPTKRNIERLRTPLRHVESAVIGKSADLAAAYGTDAMRKVLLDLFQPPMIGTKHIAVFTANGLICPSVVERKHIGQFLNRRIDFMRIRAWHPLIFIFIEAKRQIQHPPHRLSRKSCLRVQSSMQSAPCGRSQRDNAINERHCRRVSEDHSSQAHH